VPAGSRSEISEGVRAFGSGAPVGFEELVRVGVRGVGEEDLVEAPGRLSVSESRSGAAAVGTLIGGVGYHYLRDFSAGVVAWEELAAEPWPDRVEVEDLGYNPVAVAHRLQGADPPVERLVVVAAARRGRTSGTVTPYRWDGTLPGAEELQARVVEAVTGVVDLDNLILVLGALDAAPSETIVVEIEPEVEASGEELTPGVRRAVEEAKRLVRGLVAGEVGSERLPEAPLGLDRLSGGRVRLEVGPAGSRRPRITPLGPEGEEEAAP